MRELYEDFGDIFAYKADPKTSFTEPKEFWKWWTNKGKYLFGDSLEGQLSEFSSVEDVVQLAPEIKKGAYKVIVVPTDMKIPVIRKRVGELIGKIEISEPPKGRRGMAKHRVTNAKVDIPSLKTSLRAYDLKQQNLNNREIYASLFPLTDEEREWAMEEDRRGNRGLLSDWDTSEQMPDDYEDEEEFLKIAGAELKEKKEEYERVERANEKVSKQLKWRMEKGIIEDGKRRDMTYEEQDEVRRILLAIELGVAVRSKQAQEIVDKKNYWNSHVGRLLKKAMANIEAVQAGYFPVSHASARKTKR